MHSVFKYSLIAVLISSIRILTFHYLCSLFILPVSVLYLCSLSMFLACVPYLSSSFVCFICVFDFLIYIVCPLVVFHLCVPFSCPISTLFTSVPYFWASFVLNILSFSWQWQMKSTGSLVTSEWMVKLSQTKFPTWRCCPREVTIWRPWGVLSSLKVWKKDSVQRLNSHDQLNKLNQNKSSKS